MLVVSNDDIDEANTNLQSRLAFVAIQERFIRSQSMGIRGKSETFLCISSTLRPPSLMMTLPIARR